MTTEREAHRHLQECGLSWRTGGLVVIWMALVYFAATALTGLALDRLWPDDPPTSLPQTAVSAVVFALVFVIAAAWWQRRTLRRFRRLQPGRVRAIGRTVTVEVAGGTLDAAVALPRRHDLRVGESVWVPDPPSGDKAVVVGERPLAGSSYVLFPRGRSTYTPAPSA